jgi:hypothetical protein
MAGAGIDEKLCAAVIGGWSLKGRGECSRCVMALAGDGTDQLSAFIKCNKWKADQAKRGGIFG